MLLNFSSLCLCNLTETDDYAEIVDEEDTYTMPSSKYLQPSTFRILQSKSELRTLYLSPCWRRNLALPLKLGVFFLFSLRICSQENIHCALFCCLFPIKMRGAAWSCMWLHRNHLALFREARWVLAHNCQNISKNINAVVSSAALQEVKIPAQQLVPVHLT